MDWIFATSASCAIVLLIGTIASLSFLRQRRNAFETWKNADIEKNASVGNVTEANILRILSAGDIQEQENLFKLLREGLIMDARLASQGPQEARTFQMLPLSDISLSAISDFIYKTFLSIAKPAVKQNLQLIPGIFIFLDQVSAHHNKGPLWGLLKEDYLFLFDNYLFLRGETAVEDLQVYPLRYIKAFPKELISASRKGSFLGLLQNLLLASRASTDVPSNYLPICSQYLDYFPEEAVRDELLCRIMVEAFGEVCDLAANNCIFKRTTLLVIKHILLQLVNHLESRNMLSENGLYDVLNMAMGLPDSHIKEEPSPADVALIVLQGLIPVGPCDQATQKRLFETLIGRIKLKVDSNRLLQHIVTASSLLDADGAEKLLESGTLEVLISNYKIHPVHEEKPEIERALKVLTRNIISVLRIDHGKGERYIRTMMLVQDIKLFINSPL